MAYYSNKPQAGTGWNQLERAKRQRELNCGFTLFGWDGDTLTWESSPPRDEGDTGRTVHYLYEPDSFVPVAQALRKGAVRLHKQPDWRGRSYDFDQDPCGTRMWNCRRLMRLPGASATTSARRWN